MAEDVVAREHRVLFFQDKAHVVLRVAGAVDRADRGALHLEDLTVGDGLLVFARRVFIHCRGEARVESNQIRDTTGVVPMPMGEKDVGQRGRCAIECGRDQVGPFRVPLTSVDNESGRACPDNIGVCALQCELDPVASAVECIPRHTYQALYVLKSRQ